MDSALLHTIWHGPAHQLLPYYDGDLASAEPLIVVQLFDLNRVTATQFRSTIMMPLTTPQSPRKAPDYSCSASFDFSNVANQKIRALRF